MFKIYRWILDFPIIYYFVKTYKKYEYFKTNEKLNSKDFSIYFALAFYVSNLSNLLIVSMFKFKGRMSLINEPLRFNNGSICSTNIGRNCISWSYNE